MLNKLKQPKNNRRSAFTLVEMLLVLVILATLAAIVIPKMAGRSKQAQVTAAKTQIESISNAVRMYETDNGDYPRSLDALFNAPGNLQTWKGPYMEKAIPNDPWGTPYVYEFPGKHNPNGFDLWSAGPDMQAGTEDDITNWDVGK